MATAPVPIPPNRNPSRDPGREAWGLIFNLMTAEMAFPKLAAEFDLSPMQAKTLHRLHAEGPVPMSSIAGGLHCDASNVTGIVDRLEARGIIERRPAEHDRRVKELHLTAAGEEMTTRLLDRMSTPPPSIAALSRADQRALRDIMRRAMAARAEGSPG